MRELGIDTQGAVGKYDNVRCPKTKNAEGYCSDKCAWFDCYNGGIYCLNRPLGKLTDTLNPRYKKHVSSK